ncbi:hypothetical protein FB451DRAFT_23371 [Mycena latifolia]|nr:hypothetical protein FB451DRAFT_23371 [Mycena latifolia]
MALLGGILSGILGGGETDTTKGILPTLPTLPFPSLTLPGLPTLGLPTSSASSASISASASLPISSSASALSTSSSTSASSATSLSAPSVPTTSPSAAATTTALPDVTTGTDGAVHTVSRVFTVTSPSSASQSAAPATHAKSFLQNKALSGTVFALAGLVGLVLLVGLVTLAMRRSRRRRLLDDAVSFDPGLLAAADRADRFDGSEKGHSSNASLGTMGSGRPTPGYGDYRAEPAPHHGYGDYRAEPAPHPGYYGASQTVQQPYYSSYVPPMTDASPPPALAGTTYPSRAPHTIPRVPVPQQPLPAEFGSSVPDGNNRQSIEESEFWARTLKVGAH